MNEFTAKFSETSDQALLHVLEFSDQYLPEALEAAIAELERRNLTAEQTAAARVAARQYEAKKQAKANKQQEQLDKPGKKFKLFWDKISPWQEEISTPLFKYKMILLLWLILAANGIYGFISSIVVGDLGDLTGPYLIYTLTALISTVLPTIGAYLFYKDNKFGWMLLAALSYLSFISVFMSMIYQMFPSQALDLDPSITNAAPAIFISFLYLIYHGVIIFLLLDKSIRAMFKITGPHIINSVLLTLVVLALQFLPLLFIALK